MLYGVFYKCIVWSFEFYGTDNAAFSCESYRLSDLVKTTTISTAIVSCTSLLALLLCPGQLYYYLAYSLDTMPCKPRSKPLRQHYTRDLKRRVIYQAEVLGYSLTKIAIELSMPLTVVQRVRRTWSEIGEVCRDRKYKGRAPLMSTEAVAVSLPSLLLHELYFLISAH